MPTKVATAGVTPQDALSVIGRPKMAAMTLEDSALDSHVSRLFFDVVDRVHGKREAAAATVGKERANFTRDMKKLLIVLEGLGPDVLANFGAGLVRDYGAAIETPEQRAERVIDGVTTAFNELRQLIHHLARTA